MASDRLVGTGTLWALRVLGLIAAAVSLYLAIASFGTDTVAGCGGESGCATVLKSPWSRWFGQPVSLGGVLVYAGMVVGLFMIGPGLSRQVRRYSWMGLIVLLTLAVGSAAWFVGLQVFALEALCIYCMSVHACGLILACVLIWPIVRRRTRSDPFAVEPQHAGWLGLLAAVGLCALVVGQVVFQPSTFQEITYEGNRWDPVVSMADSGVSRQKLENLELNPSSLLDDPLNPTENDASAGSGLESDAPDETPPKSPGRKIKLWQDIEIDLNEVPVLGPRDADYVIAMVTDFTCVNCRAMHRHLDKAIERYDGQLAVAVLFSPLDRQCNRHVQRTHYDNRDGCKFARYALAIWKVKPEALHDFEKYMNQERRRLNEAKAKAGELIGPDRLRKALLDRQLAKMIEKGVKTYSRLGQGYLPKLVLPETGIVGVPGKADRLFQFLETHLDIKPVPKRASAQTPGQ